MCMHDVKPLLPEMFHASVSLRIVHRFLKISLFRSSQRIPFTASKQVTMMTIISRNHLYSYPWNIRYDSIFALRYEYTGCLEANQEMNKLGGIDFQSIEIESASIEKSVVV